MKLNIITGNRWYEIVNIETGEIISDKIQGLQGVNEFLSDTANIDVLKYIEGAVEANIYNDYLQEEDLQEE